MRQSLFIYLSDLFFLRISEDELLIAINRCFNLYHVYNRNENPSALRRNG